MKVNLTINIPRLTIFIPIIVYLGLIIISFKFSFPLRGTYNYWVGNFKGTLLEDKLIKDLPPVQLLTNVFERVDRNSDSFISVSELSEYIQAKTSDHIKKAVDDNYALFMAIDKKPRNGVVSWEEYHEYFLQKHGVDDEYIKKHSEKHTGLARILKEMIARDMAAWVETARSDPDILTLDEFLTFTHPESSQANVATLADDLLDKLDRDGDEYLTEDEFARLQVGDDTEVRQGENERRSQFRSQLDSNSDGKADREEILKYLEPSNPRHAREEAETLVALSDTDRDGKLVLSEVLAKIDLFLGSKVVDAEGSFHDEF